MKTISLEAKTDIERLIKEYLEENASDALVAKIANLLHVKSLAGAVKYIKHQAREHMKDSCAMVSDEVVYGWAVHYFEEDSLDFEKADIGGTVKSSAKPKKEVKKEEPKEEGRQQMDMFGEFMNA